jgi:carboxyl-terminal processing protease
MLQSFAKGSASVQLSAWKRGLISFVAAAALCGAGFAFGYRLAASGVDSPNLRLALLVEAEEALRAQYISPLPTAPALTYGTIKGMLQTVGDPYTIFVEPASHELEEDSFSGEYGGIGAEIRPDGQGIIHLIPFEGGPAARAGIAEGDSLVQVDGWDVALATRLDEVAAALRGPVGSSVRLQIRPLNGTGDVVELEITRESFPLPSVTSYISPDEHSIGVIAISLFTDLTQQEVTDAFGDLRERGIKSLVLDLRNNPGGLLGSSVEVARFFLASGVILIEQARDQEEQVMQAEEAGPASEISLAVLVDGTSASAAEVLAAALQANGRAPLIGSRTVGKGSVQALVELSDGSSLHITRARWLTPTRELIDGKGLTPDIEVQPSEDDTDALMRAAIEFLLGNGDRAP